MILLTVGLPPFAYRVEEYSRWKCRDYSLFVHGLTLSRKEINPPFISGGQNVGNSCLGVASGWSAADQCQVPRLCHSTTARAFYRPYKRLHHRPVARRGSDQKI
jgi:hypothetical protein